MTINYAFMVKRLRLVFTKTHFH